MTYLRGGHENSVGTGWTRREDSWRGMKEMIARSRRGENERTRWVDGALEVWQIDYIINTRPEHATHATLSAPVRFCFLAALPIDFLLNLSLPQPLHSSFSVIFPPWLPYDLFRF